MSNASSFGKAADHVCQLDDLSVRPSEETVGMVAYCAECGHGWEVGEIDVMDPDGSTRHLLGFKVPRGVS